MKFELTEEQKKKRERQFQIEYQYNIPRQVECDIIKYFPNTTLKEADLLWKTCVTKALAKFGDECITDNFCRGMSYAQNLMAQELKELTILKETSYERKTESEEI